MNEPKKRFKQIPMFPTTFAWKNNERCTVGKVVVKFDGTVDLGIDDGWYSGTLDKPTTEALFRELAAVLGYNIQQTVFFEQVEAGAAERSDACKPKALRADRLDKVLRRCQALGKTKGDCVESIVHPGFCCWCSAPMHYSRGTELEGK